MKGGKDRVRRFEVNTPCRLQYLQHISPIKYQLHCTSITQSEMWETKIVFVIMFRIFPYVRKYPSPFSIDQPMKLCLQTIYKQIYIFESYLCFVLLSRNIRQEVRSHDRVAVFDLRSHYVS